MVEVKSITLLYFRGHLTPSQGSLGSLLEPVEIGQGYLRRDERRTRGEDSRVSPAGYASSFWPQRTRRWRRHVWDHRTPYTFGNPPLLRPHPRSAPPPPFYPSVVPFHARLVGDSRGRAFSSLISLSGPPSVLFHFICFCAGYASTSMDTRNTWMLSIDSTFVKSILNILIFIFINRFNIEINTSKYLSMHKFNTSHKVV